MIYVFIALTAVALAFVLLGALSVWVVILSLALKAMLLIAGASVIYFILQRLFGRKA